MHLRRVIGIVALLLVIAVGSGFAIEYDSEVVVGAMRNNLAQLQNIGKGIEDGDYFVIATAFFALAEGMIEILPMDAPRGEDEQWKMTVTEVINTAFLGVGACGVRYDAGIQDAFQKLRALSQKGHMDHRPPRN